MTTEISRDSEHTVSRQTLVGSVRRAIVALTIGVFAAAGMFGAFGPAAAQGSNPELTIASPANNSSLSSARVLFSGSATDDVALDRIELVVTALDARSEFAPGIDELTSTLSTSGNQASWGVQLVIPNGSFRASATAFDAQGNSSTVSTVDFKVNAADGRDQTAPDVVIEPFGELRDGVIVASSAISLRGTAIDATAVSSVDVSMKRGSEFIRSDGTVAASAVSYEAALDPNQGPRVRWFQAYRLDPGDYQVSIQATDSEGNETRTINRTFEVPDLNVVRDAFGNDPDDEIDIVTTPPGESNISATISVTDGDVIAAQPTALIGTATAAVGVESVELVIRHLETGDLVDLDGRPVSSTTAVEADVLQQGSETSSWLGSARLPDGQYEIDVRVIDVGGNVGGLERPLGFEVVPSNGQVLVPGQTTTSSIPVFRPTTTAPGASLSTTTTSTTTPTTSTSSLDTTTTTTTSPLQGDELALGNDDGPRWLMWLFVLALVAFVILTALGIMVWAFARSRARL